MATLAGSGRRLRAWLASRPVWLARAWDGRPPLQLRQWPRARSKAEAEGAAADHGVGRAAAAAAAAGGVVMAVVGCEKASTDILAAPDGLTGGRGAAARGGRSGAAGGFVGGGGATPARSGGAAHAAATSSCEGASLADTVGGRVGLAGAANGTATVMVGGVSVAADELLVVGSPAAVGKATPDALHAAATAGGCGWRRRGGGGGDGRARCGYADGRGRAGGGGRACGGGRPG